MIQPRALLWSADQTMKARLATALAALDYSLESLSDPEAVLALTSPRQVDVIFLDGALEAEQVEEVCRKLRRSPPARRIPVIGLVNLDDEKLCEALLALGCDELASNRVHRYEVLARIGTQLRSKRLLNEFEDQTRDRKLLLELENTLASRLEIRQILRIVAQRLTEAISVERCSIILVDQERHQGIVVAASEDNALADLRIDLNKYPEIREVLDTKAPLVVSDAESDPLLAEVRAKVASASVRASILFPMSCADQVIGVLLLRSAGAIHDVSARELDFGQTVASATAIAIRNARLFETMVRESVALDVERNEVLARFETLQRTEAELKKTKDFLENIINSSVDAIVVSSPSGEIVIFSRAAERLLGYSASDVVGRMNMDQLFRSVDGIMWSRFVHEGEGRVVGTQRELIARNGDIITVSCSASSVRENEREVGLLGVFTDIRERLQMENKLVEAQEKLVQSERQAVIAELAGATAHELNQPLTSILGYAEMLRRKMGDDASLQRQLGIIKSEAERMAEIVRKIGRITHYETKTYVGSTRIVDLDRSVGSDES